MNHVVLVGRLTKDLELRYIAGNGTPVANFVLAVDREFAGKDGKKETVFLNIQVWGKSAENCANYIGKGSLVAVQGSIIIEKYEKDGERRTFTKINANKVQFLDSKKDKQENKNFTPSFKPSGLSLDIDEFEAIHNDDIPF